MDYYIIKFIINDKEYCCIYCSGDKDTIINDGNKITVFSDENAILKYMDSQNLSVSDMNYITIYDVDYIENWVNSNDNSVDCDHVINFWNISTDVAYSLDKDFLGDKKTEKINKIYDKLFWGLNLSSVSPEDKKYEPVWSIDEISLMKEIISDGLVIIKNSLV